MKLFTIGGISMSSPIILGAGVAKHPNQAHTFMHPDAPLGAVISGSYTLDPREGNKGELMWPADFGGLTQNGFGLNAWGMPNMGLSYALGVFPLMSWREKPHVVSIAGFNASEYITMLHLLKGRKEVAGVELNSGCPNTGHLPVAYTLEDLARLLEDVAGVGFDKPVWLKLSPYMTADELEFFASENLHLDFSGTPIVSSTFLVELCELLAEHTRTISAVVMTNTLPNVVHRDSLTIRNADGSAHHKGGLSGPLLRTHNLKLIWKIQSLGFPSELDIIGCGGIMTGEDVLDYIQTGCAGVECTSGPAWSDVKFFQSLLEGSEGLQEYLFSKQGESR
jgi:dihydroorotate dehydrogenase